MRSWLAIFLSSCLLCLACENDGGGGPGVPKDTQGGSDKEIGFVDSHEPDGGGGCTSDGDCARGTVCVAGACEVIACAGIADCHPGEVCVDLDGDGDKECTQVECAEDADCGAAEICQGGACQPAVAKPEPEVIEPDVVDPDATAPDTTEPDTTAPDITDPETITPEGFCQPCGATADCADGLGCVALPAGSFCLTPCAGNAACVSGTLCVEMQPGQSSCVPGLYNTCAACLAEPCAAGETCNQASGTCVPASPPCGACLQDGDCGLGARCVFHGGLNRCVPECEGGACPENAACQILDGSNGSLGVFACLPDGPECCFGEACDTCDCSGSPATPHCDHLGHCVTCLEDAHCALPGQPYCSPAGTCVTCLIDAHCQTGATCDQGTCVGAGCPLMAPHPCLQSPDGCCECVMDAHCLNPLEPSCEIVSGTCVPGEGCPCVEPYPACLSQNGQLLCVACTEDAHCPATCACDASSYTCVGSDGGACEPVGCAGDCLTAGCPTGLSPDPITAFDLECDPGSGCCYDDGGLCDGEHAFCLGEAAVCAGFDEILAGQPIGALLPGWGLCSCTQSITCLLGELFPPLGGEVCCPGGQLCVDEEQVLQILMGGAPPSSPSTSGAPGWCVAAGGTTCVPSCAGKDCGGDGCGGSCGTCGSGATCNTMGQCVADLVGCLDASEGALSFGPVFMGASSAQPVTLSNCSASEALTLTGVSINGALSECVGVFCIALPTSATGGQPVSTMNPVVLGPGESLTATLTYAPQVVHTGYAGEDPELDTAVLIVKSSAMSSTLAVPMDGFGVPSECPFASFTIQEGQEVIPQTVLHLSSAGAMSLTGSVTQFAWSATQPPLSTAVFVPSASFPSPSLQANMAGTYVLRLDVWDDQGIKSCEPATRTVHVIPADALHVELIWDTPGDADPHDTGPYAGSDLDLHFAHPSASQPDLDGDGHMDPWFDPTFDCFWFYPHPDWGSYGDADDDPSLDRDDTDGAGPENINLDVPQDGHTYHVGVHYWDDHGFGASYATARIYVYGYLVFEHADVYMVDHDMWWVADLAWPATTVTLKETASGALWLTHDYMHASFYQP